MPAEQEQLRQLNEDQRWEWFRSQAHWMPTVGKWSLKVDRSPIIFSEEDQDLAFEMFCKLIDGPDIVVRQGGMG